jgi:hypothetical protein
MAKASYKDGVLRLFPESARQSVNLVRQTYDRTTGIITFWDAEGNPRVTIGIDEFLDSLIAEGTAQQYIEDCESFCILE